MPRNECNRLQAQIADDFSSRVPCHELRDIWAQGKTNDGKDGIQCSGNSEAIIDSPFQYTRLILYCIEQMIQRHDQECLDRFVDQIEPFDMASDPKSVCIRNIADEARPDTLVQKWDDKKQA